MAAVSRPCCHRCWRHALAVLLMAACAACATPAFHAAGALPREGVREVGAPTDGSSCALHVLGLPLGEVRADDAVVQALRNANSRDRRPRSRAYNALADAAVRETISPFSHCLAVRGRPVWLAAPEVAP